jgi:hypothetical protein
MIELIFCISLAIFTNFITNTMHLLSTNTCLYSHIHHALSATQFWHEAWICSPLRTGTHQVEPKFGARPRFCSPPRIWSKPMRGWLLVWTFGLRWASYTCHRVNHTYLRRASHCAIQIKNLRRNHGFCRLAMVIVRNTLSNLYHINKNCHQTRAYQPWLNFCPAQLYSG